MSLNVKGAWSVFKIAVGTQSCVATDGTLLRVPPRRLLLAGLIVGAAYLPTYARAADATVHGHTSSVIMMIGGTKNADDAAAQPRSAEPGAVATDAGRLSVVIQPGSSPFAAAARQASASAASRIEALAPMIDEAARAADVDSALLMAVIEVESGGNPRAVSPKGATGLMQLMPGTGARHGASDLFDPCQNVAAGARYLKDLMRQFGDLSLVLAAYNAGEGAVQKYGGEIPPYAETMSYVPKVMDRYRWYRDATPSASVATVQDVSSGVRGRFLRVGSGAGN